MTSIDKIESYLKTISKKWFNKKYEFDKNTIDKLYDFINFPNHRSFDFIFLKNNNKDYLDLELYEDEEEGIYDIDRLEKRLEDL